MAILQLSPNLIPNFSMAIVFQNHANYLYSLLPKLSALVRAWALATSKTVLSGIDRKIFILSHRLPILQMRHRSRIFFVRSRIDLSS